MDIDDPKQAAEAVEFLLLRTTRDALAEVDKQTAERVLNYLKHWNDKRPARND